MRQSQHIKPGSDNQNLSDASKVSNEEEKEEEYSDNNFD
jgi:hypothetical protein